MKPAFAMRPPMVNRKGVRVKTRRASDLAKSLIVDIDEAVCRVSRPVEDRHSAAASAVILAARLAGGLCVNVARIADALDDLADHFTTEKSDEPPAS